MENDFNFFKNITPTGETRFKGVVPAAWFLLCRGF